MEWLTDLIGLGASAATGGLLGAGLRMIPALAGGIGKIFTAAGDRKHELDMRKLDWEIAKSGGEQKIRELDTAGGWDVAGKTLDAMREALKGQETPSGIGWADALSKAVRPLTTYYFLSLYGIVKFLMFGLALGSSDVTTAQAVAVLWTPADSQMLFGLLGFWFVDRQLGKQAVGR